MDQKHLARSTNMKHLPFIEILYQGNSLTPQMNQQSRKDNLQEISSVFPGIKLAKVSQSLPVI